MHVFSPFEASASGGRSGAFCSALGLTLFFVLYGNVSLFAEPIVQHCKALGSPFDVTWEDNSKRVSKATTAQFTNPLYEEDHSFRAVRHAALLGLTLREADFARRIMAAVLLGSLIGLERRAPNRAAGVRTMAMVSMGACVFTICSSFDFEDGSQEWDASRIAAALPSGVGFLGGAVIFKHSGSVDQKPELVGLTTACGIWLSCAIGTCCGGALYFPAAFGTACMVATLRFGPRRPTDGSDGQQEDDAPDGDWRSHAKKSSGGDPLGVPLVPGPVQPVLSRQTTPTDSFSAQEKAPKVKRTLSLSCDE